ncbi:hypothetical protein GTA08_BOTSDO04577 [Botryosphaeria dothidea]|uniref:Retrovirus-related Pol polyprotein from transposon TNT 1-94-like beta-barrel domain-containing protein n=1 Tax=Botryosphaeria dothidea TaxID=55169 RepID=A0A8H4NAI7_9PEZI|nr:hypothetical protein GTA08_BOTSDO04577 [Botryosphaeria dothidea]
MTPGLNINAWVVLCGYSHAICNDRKKFISYDSFASPIPVYSFIGKTGVHAIGVGEVRLHIRLENGRIRACMIKTVLHVPDAAVNLLTMANMADLAGSKDGWTVKFGPGGKLVEKDGGRTLAWFPCRRRTEEGLFVLRQGYQFDRLWFPYHPKEKRSDFLLTCWVEEQPLKVLKPIRGPEELRKEMRKLFTDTDDEAKESALERLLVKDRIDIDQDDLDEAMVDLVVWLAESLKCKEQEPTSRGSHAQKGRARETHPKSKDKEERKTQSRGKGPVPMEQRPVDVIGWSLHDGRKLVKGGKQWSKVRFLKKNWRNRYRFQLHYGLTMNPKDLEEGDEILSDYRERGYYS